MMVGELTIMKLDCSVPSPPPATRLVMARRKGKKQEEENVQLGPQVVEGENVFGVAHIFASFNDTFIHVTDLSGR